MEVERHKDWQKLVCKQLKTDIWDSPNQTPPPNQTPRWLRGTCLWTSVCVCVCAICVCQRALLHPVALQTVLVREGGRRKSGFLSLLWAEFEGAQICACKMNGLLVYILSPPKSTSSCSTKPRILSLSHAKKKTHCDSPSHKQPMLSQTCT